MCNVCGYVRMNVDAHGIQKSMGSQAVVSHLVWVLAMRLGSFARALCTLSPITRLSSTFPGMTQ